MSASESVPSRGPGRSPHRDILRAVVTVGASSAVVKLALVVRDLFLSAQYGASAALDAFFLAYVVPAFLIGVFAGSLPLALLPGYIRARGQRTREAGDELLANGMAVALPVLAVFSLIGALLAFAFLPWAAPHMGPAEIRAVRLMMVLMLPAVLVSGLASVWAALLTSEGRFATAALVPVITPTATVVALLLLGSQVGVVSLAAGVAGGTAIEACVLGFLVKRRGLRLRPRWAGLTPDVRAVMREYWPVVAGSALLAGTLPIDQAMAAQLGPGAVASLSFGAKVVGLTLGIGSLAITTALFPTFANLAAREDWHRLGGTYRVWLVVVLVGGAVVAVPLSIYSHEVIRLVFERGAFTASDTREVAAVQAAFALQIPFYIAGALAGRVLSSIGKNRWLLIVAAVSLVTNIVGNLLLAPRFGIAGIAWSTTIVYVVSFMILGLVAARSLRTRQADVRARRHA